MQNKYTLRRFFDETAVIHDHDWGVVVIQNPLETVSTGLISHMRKKKNPNYPNQTKPKKDFTTADINVHFKYFHFQ